MVILFVLDMSLCFFMCIKWQTQSTARDFRARTQSPENDLGGDRESAGMGNRICWAKAKLLPYTSLLKATLDVNKNKYWLKVLEFGK